MPTFVIEPCRRFSPEECWRPAFARYLHVRFTGLKRDLDRYVDEYNFRRVHNGRLTRGRIPADIVYGANKVTKMPSRRPPLLAAHAHV